jgi:hypothetical protein
MKSNIFGTDEPASARSFSDMNKSNIFGVNDKDEQSKRPTQVRQGLRGKLKITDKDDKTTRISLSWRLKKLFL